MRGLAIMALGVVLVAGPAVAADRFDLNCALQETTTVDGGTADTFTRHISLDLIAGEYCFWDNDSCMKLSRFALVTDDEIRLDDINNDMMTLETSIDRRTWRLTNHATVRQLTPGTSHTEGACTPAPFTPFPAGAAPPA